MKQILIVEDNSNLAHSIQEALAEKYKCIITACGRRGYQLARNKSFDLALIDINLPNLTGLNIVKMLRQDRIELPIIIISAESEIYDICRGLSIGADDYITKPFNITELKTRVDRFIKRPPITREDIIELNNLTINLATNEVVYENKIIELRKKELQIFQYFVRNKGQIITREQLLNNLWSVSEEPFSSTVDVHISNIRRKLKASGSIYNIRTIHGVGYIWDEVTT